MTWCKGPWSPEKQAGAPCWHSDHINRWIKTESSEFPLQGNLRWCHSSRGSCQINGRTSSIMIIVGRKPLGRSPQQRERIQCRPQPDPGLWGAMIRAEDVLAQFNGRLYGLRHGIHPETTQFLLRSWILTVIKFLISVVDIPSETKSYQLYSLQFVRKNWL